MRIFAIHADRVPGIGGMPTGMHRIPVGVLAYHVESEDGLFVYDGNEDFSVCRAVALCEVVSSDPETGWTTVDVRPYEGCIEPPSTVRWRWRDDPYLCLDASRVRHYDLLDTFAVVFGDRSWTTRTLRDRVRSAIHHDLSKPTLSPVEGFVYLLRSSTLHKIGKALDVEERKKRIEREIGESLELIHFFPSNDNGRAEAELHLKYSGSRKYGEWFDLSPADVSEISRIQEINYVD